MWIRRLGVFFSLKCRRLQSCHRRRPCLLPPNRHCYCGRLHHRDFGKGRVGSFPPPRPMGWNSSPPLELEGTTPPVPLPLPPSDDEQVIPSPYPLPLHLCYPYVADRGFKAPTVTCRPATSLFCSPKSVAIDAAAFFCESSSRKCTLQNIVEYVRGVFSVGVTYDKGGIDNEPKEC